MNYKNVTVPYLHFSQIEENAESFREKYWGNTIPVDLEHIIEIKLKIRIIPIPGFYKIAGMAAMITSNCEDICVDDNEFNDGHRINHLRFSLAHEVGHLILHRGFYNNLGIKDSEDYYKLNRDFSNRQYFYLESQANKFASYLLIPRKILFTERAEKLKKISPSLLGKADKIKINSFLAIPLSKVFNVSEKAIEIALNDI